MEWIIVGLAAVVLIQLWVNARLREQVNRSQKQQIELLAQIESLRFMLRKIGGSSMRFLNFDSRNPFESDAKQDSAPGQRNDRGSVVSLSRFAGYIFLLLVIYGFLYAAGFVR